MKRGNFPFIYLGLPLFKGKPTISSLLPIANKVRDHMESWKGNTFSFAGWVCLADSVNSSMFIHSFMI